MNNIHTNFDQTTIEKLDDLFRQWLHLDNMADRHSYQNEAANNKADAAYAEYKEAYENALELKKAAHLAAHMLEQCGDELRMARWNVEAVQ